MRTTGCLFASAILLAACAELPDETAVGDDQDPGIDNVGRIGSNRIGSNRIGSNRIGSNRIGSNRLSANALGGARITSHRISANMDGAGMLLATPEGREVFAVLVACALPDNLTIVADMAGTRFEFPGEMNLARQWLFAPLDSEGQAWVSACVFAKVNANDVAVDVSFRGLRSGLVSTADERDEFSVEEGAFFGDMFVPLDQPIQWFACRGEGQAAGEFGGLVDRDCTEPDPARPGFTRCGFMFAGDCGEFARNNACDVFLERAGIYTACRSQPRSRRNDRRFFEVVTTFVRP